MNFFLLVLLCEEWQLNALLVKLIKDARDSNIYNGLHNQWLEYYNSEKITLKALLVRIL